MRRPSAILIAGPTASGKSDLALRLARQTGGIVLNADSMQVYRDLAVLTARPTAAQQAEIPHGLYGFVDAADAYSTGRYVKDAEAAIQAARRDGLLPIVVGGTGLYFKALTEGLSPIPGVPEAVRRYWRGEVARIGPAAAHAVLAERDPETAGKLAPGDRQRVTRALEVLDASGHPIGHWQRLPKSPVIDRQSALCLTVSLPRTEIHARCDRRFDAMLAAGALEEVERLVDRRLDPALPVMGALGVRPLADHLAGRLSLEAAAELGKLQTRQYVKRQLTWIARHMIAWNYVESPENFKFSANNLS